MLGCLVTLRMPRQFGVLTNWSSLSQLVNLAHSVPVTECKSANRQRPLKWLDKIDRVVNLITSNRIANLLLQQGQPWTWKTTVSTLPLNSERGSTYIVRIKLQKPTTRDMKTMDNDPARVNPVIKWVNFQSRVDVPVGNYSFVIDHLMAN